MLTPDHFVEFGLTPSDVILKPNKIFLIKENWDYELCLKAQQFSLDYVRHHPQQEITFLCSHPPIFTIGRGLQKSRDPLPMALEDFALPEGQALPFPLFKIKRGGGLTFHHPGQFIIYPIRNLNHPGNKLKTLTYGMLGLLADILKQHYGIEDLSSDHPLLGLWYRQERKLASAGIAIEHFVTYHGFALNLLPGPILPPWLRPCGIKGDLYISVQEILAGKDQLTIAGNNLPQNPVGFSELLEFFL